MSGPFHRVGPTFPAKTRLFKGGFEIDRAQTIVCVMWPHIQPNNLVLTAHKLREIRRRLVHTTKMTNRITHCSIH